MWKAVNEHEKDKKVFQCYGAILHFNLNHFHVTELLFEVPCGLKIVYSCCLLSASVFLTTMVS